MKKRKGLTLIETILSLAILGIIGVFILTVFGFSLNNIRRAGKRTEDVFQLGDEIDKIIFKSTDEAEDGIVRKISQDEKTLVHIPGIGDKEVRGMKVTVELKDKNRTRITTFVPYEEEEKGRFDR